MFQDWQAKGFKAPIADVRKLIAGFIQLEEQNQKLAQENLIMAYTIDVLRDKLYDLGPEHQITDEEIRREYWQLQDSFRIRINIFEK